MIWRSSLREPLRRRRYEEQNLKDEDGNHAPQAKLLRASLVKVFKCYI
jgi:hypothetical protein